ncbi:hypothetical protein ACH4ZU_38895 [Streptomyces sp. NPDC020472]|uniref:hypothetical protein n=1 Tax=Streptomyces sp. NPDC020472 TaxID=3365075 RepID=UPI0037B6CA60
MRRSHTTGPVLRTRIPAGRRPLGRIRAFPAGRPETAHGELTLPMRTGVLRVRRL